jgi:hypothetical protein
MCHEQLRMNFKISMFSSPDLEKPACKINPPWKLDPEIKLQPKK